MVSPLLDPQDRRASIVVFSTALALTLVMALPVLMAPSERLFGNESVGRHADAYTMIRQFDSPPRLWYFTQPATDWIGALFGSLVGGTTAFNVLTLITFPLAAVTTFWLARFLSLAVGAAALSALAFAFSPFHLAHAAYHPHIVQVQWIPLYLLALAACVDRWTSRRLGLLALSAALASMSNFYAGLILGVLTPVALVAFSLLSRVRRGPDPGRPPGWIATTATLAAIGGTGALYVWLAAPNVLANPQAYGFPFEDLVSYSARWWSYFVPPVDHAILGSGAREIWGRHGIGGGLVEQQLYLGLGPLALAAIACAEWVRRRHETPGVGAMPAIVAIGAAAFLASLGPVQRLPGGMTVPRLSGLLHSLLPMFRAYARFGSVLTLMVCLAAGIGFAVLWRSRAGKRIAAAILALLVFELTPLPPRWHWVLPTEAHRWAAGREGEMHILECVENSSMARSVSHFLTPHRMAFLGRAIDDCAEPDLAAKAAALGHTHLLVRADGHLRDLLPESGLELTESFADSSLYAVTADPPNLYISRTSGFSWRETDGERSWRWMGPRGLWQLENRSGGRLETVLVVELASFHRPRSTTVKLDGQLVATLEVGTDPADFEIPLWVEVGEHSLWFSNDVEPDSPRDVLGSADDRDLSISFGRWYWRP